MRPRKFPLALAALFAIAIPLSGQAPSGPIAPPQVAQSDTQEDPQILDQSFPEGGKGTMPVEGALVPFLQFAGVSGGMVVTQGCDDNTPFVYWSAVQGTIRQALNDFQANNPEYRWELRGGTLDLVPAAGIPPLLATKIRRFNLQTTDQQTSAGAAFGMLMKLPEIQEAATVLHISKNMSVGGPQAAWDYSSGKTPPRPPPPRPVSVQLKDVSLQDALNALAKEYGHTMWTYWQRSCEGETTYTVNTTRTVAP